jgi:replication factor C subunit 3/5
VAPHVPVWLAVAKLAREQRLPHLLLYGPPGTGKTSTVLAIARELYGKQAGSMALELNASDDRGIDVVRQQISDFASTAQLFAKGHKLVVLDECDQMTKDAQFALRRIMERHSRSTRFCLLCNHVSKVIPAIQSRCTRFRFSPLPPEDARSRVQHVASAEGVDLTDDGLDAVLKIGSGDMRRSINILQSVHMAAGHIDSRAVHLCTGTPEQAQVEGLLSSLLCKPFKQCVDHVLTLQSENGVALVDLVRELGALVFRLGAGAAARAELVDALADCEYRLSYATCEKVQVQALVGAFVNARDSISQAAR